MNAIFKKQAMLKSEREGVKYELNHNIGLLIFLQFK